MVTIIKIACLLLALSVSIDSYSQALFKVEGRYKNLSSQGMAIFGSKAYLLNNTGICRVYNLKKNRMISSFPIGSASKTNHANCASFGVEKIGKRKDPVMYVSECAKPYRCFVEEVGDKSSKLVQTITVKRDERNDIAHDWVVDKDSKTLYAISNLKSYYKKEGRNVHRITQYRLPKLSEGSDVVLTDNDVLNSFDVEFPNLLQGATIKGKHMYLPVGLQKGKENRADSERALIIINLKTRKIENKIDLSKITVNEPEDCDFYKKKLLLFCGQEGGLYEIPIK